MSFRLRKLLIRAEYLLRRISLSTKSRDVHLCNFGAVSLALDFSEPVHRFIYLGDGFEPETTAVLRRIVNPGDVVVDIGANIGWHTLSLLVSRPDVAMVYAIEPLRRNFDLLIQGILANNCQDRCDARRLALSDSRGTVRLRKFEGMDLMHASMYPLGDLSFEEEEVAVDTLDSVSETFKAPPAVIKCDVEGAERSVLLGAHRILSGQKGTPPIWFMEVNYETSAMADYFPWELAELGARYGYSAHTIRKGQIVSVVQRKGLRQGDMLVLAIPELHCSRLEAVGWSNFRTAVSLP
jgi:FkbM family methyltransferase